VAVNFHPRYSPDGQTIAFVSDRQGQNNLWLMNADGARPRAVFIDKDVRVFEPAWSPDGRYIYVRRQEMKRGGGASGLWMYSRDGGEGVEIVGRDVRGAEWPSASPDGKFSVLSRVDRAGRYVVGPRRRDAGRQTAAPPRALDRPHRRDDGRRDRATVPGFERRRHRYPKSRPIVGGWHSRGAFRTARSVTRVRPSVRAPRSGCGISIRAPSASPWIRLNWTWRKA